MSIGSSAGGWPTAPALIRRLARGTYRALLGQPPTRDLGRTWPGTAAPGLRTLRLVHVGDCGFRRMELGHDMTAPPGYPLVAAERLLDDGVGVEFRHYFAIGLDELPDMERLQRVIRLDAAPDVVVVQLGGSAARKVVLPHKKPIHRLRADGNRRAGRHIYLAHRVLRQLVRIFGRYPTKHPGTVELERFLMELKRTWPAARVVVMPPFPRSHNYREQLRIAERTDADMKAAAARCGVPVIDTAPVLGFEPSLRCANAYNLNGKGARAVGDLLADWIVEHALSVAQEGEPDGGLHHHKPEALPAHPGD
jgi:lysophospholipase L1-like esterase